MIVATMPALEMDNSHESRISALEHKFDSEDARRERTKLSVQFRRVSRNDQLLKLRNMIMDPVPSKSFNELFQSSEDTLIDEIVTGMNSSEGILQLYAIQACSKLLGRKNDPPIDTMISKGIVPRCIQFLSFHHNSTLQFEASWILANLTSQTPERTMIAAKNGAIPKLVELLKSPATEVTELAVWALRNIASISSESRDQVLEQNCMPPLLALVENGTPVSLTREIISTISIFCAHKDPPPPFEIVKMALPVLYHLLSVEDPDILADVCCSLSSLTDGGKYKIQAVVESGICAKLVALLEFPDVKVLAPALRTVGNIVTGNSYQVDAILNTGGLTILRKLLEHEDPEIVEKATWTLSNITAGNREQIQRVIDMKILPPLVGVLTMDNESARREAAWAVTNLVSGGSITQRRQFIQQGVLASFCDTLDAEEEGAGMNLQYRLMGVFRVNKKRGQFE